jgi:predicted MFS family arabinose efflux permease
MLAWAGDYRRIFWVAAIPAALAVLLLAGGVREPDGAAPAARVNPLRRASIARLGRAYWWVVAIGCVFTLARFSEAFLVLRAMQSGVRPALIPLVMVAMNLVYMLSAYPFGKLADTTGHARLLLIGLALLAGADLLLAQDGQGWTVLAGVGLWGLHMGMTQGLLSMMVAQCAPAALRGTAFGLFNLACGLALLASSTAAGWLWSHVGPGATFHAGAAFCLLTALLLALRRRATATI